MNKVNPVLKQSGGRQIPLTREVIVNWMKKTNPKFIDSNSTISFPMYPNLKYKGRDQHYI